MTDNPTDSVVTDAEKPPMEREQQDWAVLRHARWYVGAYKPLTRTMADEQAELLAKIDAAMSQASPPPLSDEVERLRIALDNLQMSASRVANKYGRDPNTDALLDWEEWRAIREHCEEARAAIIVGRSRND